MKKVFASAAVFGVMIITSGCSSLNSGDSYESPDFTGAALDTSANSVKAKSSTRGRVQAYDLADPGVEVSNSSEWKVCSQSVGAGDSVSKSAIVKLGVIRIEEKCPSAKTYKSASPEKGVVSTAPVVKPNGVDSKAKDYAGQSATDAVNAVKNDPKLSHVTIYVIDAASGDHLDKYENRIVCWTTPKAGSAMAGSPNIIFSTATSITACPASPK